MMNFDLKYLKKYFIHILFLISLFFLFIYLFVFFDSPDGNKKDRDYDQKKEVNDLIDLEDNLSEQEKLVYYEDELQNYIINEFEKDMKAGIEPSKVKELNRYYNIYRDNLNFLKEKYGLSINFYEIDKLIINSYIEEGIKLTNGYDNIVGQHRKQVENILNNLKNDFGNNFSISLSVFINFLQDELFLESYNLKKEKLNKNILSNGVVLNDMYKKDIENFVQNKEGEQGFVKEEDIQTFQEERFLEDKIYEEGNCDILLSDYEKELCEEYNNKDFVNGIYQGN